ncbi:MAG TPA: hypothetical protein VHK69_16285 [Chitinophagaceae bacterium]|jgi:hypothetical protein|nr:hypothetical protein [Chitinophagaceae bacterium]
MKFLLSLLLTAALAFVAGLFLPWWSLAIAAFAVALLLPQSLGRSFLSGFLALFLLWTGLALLRDLPNDSILSRRVADLFYLGGNSALLVLVTGLIGGLVSGFSAMTGTSLRPVKKARRY